MSLGPPPQRIGTTDGPQPGKHNWFRGGTLRTYDELAQRALAKLGGHVDVDLAREIWQTALDARRDGVERWFHGDMAAGNLLLDDGELAAVIDFGTCGVGGPACDLAIAWTLLTADGRPAFRGRLSVDDATWARGDCRDRCGWNGTANRSRSVRRRSEWCWRPSPHTPEKSRTRRPGRRTPGPGAVARSADAVAGVVDSAPATATPPKMVRSL
ncbi:phosphotransferase, partial [Saccharothrix sp.]|uniref:phosphotransferase n=1 Tax=Saccharothrix sp. TaxID=1873460 RepID=UPI00281193CB